MKRPKREKEKEGEREREGGGTGRDVEGDGERWKKREIPKESVHGAEKYRQIAHTRTHVRAHDVAFNNR